MNACSVCVRQLMINRQATDNCVFTALNIRNTTLCTHVMSELWRVIGYPSVAASQPHSTHVNEFLATALKHTQPMLNRNRRRAAVVCAQASDHVFVRQQAVVSSSAHESTAKREAAVRHKTRDTNRLSKLLLEWPSMVVHGC